MNEKNKKTISKFLSLVLRHQPQEIGLNLDANGWANVDELIQKCAIKNIKFNFEDLKEVVATNEKQRFIFNEDKSKIRANQGHSIEIDLALEPIMPPKFLYHGTAEKNVTSILENGINKMNRQHVHLSQEKATAINVGSRHGKPVVLIIQSGIMYEAGLVFYKSENNVWLTDFVDKKYISK